MAKKSAVQKNNRRKALVERYAAQRAELKSMAKDDSLAPEERFKARLKLNKLPRNSSSVRVRNRCALSGRSRAYYRKFGVSRIAMRELASKGELPGVVKSSW
jgi:small subunit ribosomal protein S14